MKTEIEYVAYHRIKRVFIPIMDIESENPEDIEVYEFEAKISEQNKYIICLNDDDILPRFGNRLHI